MKTFFVCCIFLFAFPPAKTSHSVKKPPDQMTADGFAVVELFTSEGCSSCPPADAAVAEIEKEYPKNVFALSFHVDYWDYLGWKDPFSDAAYSKRQQLYGAAFSLNSIYTPQIVVNGQKEFVGSDKPLLEKTIQHELEGTHKTPIQIQAESKDNKLVTVNYSTTGASTMLLNIALVQLNGESDIRRGENKGLKLKHTNIVRAFKTIALDKQYSGSVALAIPDGLNKSACMIIGYLQTKNNLQITTAGKATIQ